MRLQVVFDSDGLIKLTKAGILDVVVTTWSCLIPKAVYEETVERGVCTAHPDAAVIRDALDPSMIRPRVHHPRAARLLGRKRGLGRGEQEALHLFFAAKADGIITDDVAFLRLLDEADVPYIPPALVLVRLALQKGLEPRAAVHALEQMRSLVRPDVYRAARADLALIGPVT